MAHRLEPPSDPVELEHDGDRIVAQRGEPIVHALLAADRLLIARGPKLHRPRGPYCLRAACDGCLARVNGVPNVTTCRVPVRGGERVETQNVLGSRGVDLLRATDFLFPQGIDHHRLFAGIRGVSNVVSRFARRVAGLGRLPSQTGRTRPAERRELDVLVVGAGQAGLSAAAGLGGLGVLVADDALAPGGSLAALDPKRARSLIDGANGSGAELALATTVAGLFREPEDPDARVWALLVGPFGATLARARAVVLAPGAHDPVHAFGNDDLPGVLSARAALCLLAGGVVIGKRIALVGRGRFADALAANALFQSERVDPDSLVRASGRSRVSSLVVREGERERKLALDAVLIDGPGAPSFELAMQAGANVRFDPERGYAPIVDENGVAAARVWCAGSVTGSDHDSSASGRAVAEHVARSLRA